jgi:hypothetical protein
MSHVGALLLVAWFVDLMTTRLNYTAHLKDDYK